MEGGKTEEGFLTKSRIQNAHHLSGNEKEECDLLKEQMDCSPESIKNNTGKSCCSSTTIESNYCNDNVLESFFVLRLNKN